MPTTLPHEMPATTPLPDPTDEQALRELAPVAGATGLSDGEHLVQFYETDEFLLRTLCEYVLEGLGAGEATLVVATAEHRAGLDERLRASGADVDGAVKSEQLVVLDAAETLATFMVGGMPNAARFEAVVGALVACAAQERQRVRIYGEMVALLQAEGNHAGALRLEQLWNTLHQTQPFTLLCAYPISSFDGVWEGQPLSEICATHGRVIPAESYTSLPTVEARLRAISVLQQQSRLLQAEVLDRKTAEAELRALKEGLELQVEDLRRLHEMSARLTSTLDMDAVLQEVLQAALSVQDTDLGLLALADAEGALTVKAHSGYDAASLALLVWVPAGDGACGACSHERRRIVVEDVALDPIFEGYREAAGAAGVRSVHCTPLITRSGTLVGVLSAHFPAPRRPSERETRLMDLYARMAADFIENARLHQQMQEELAERERLLARAQEARTEAEQANRFKDEFLATISHELRTPLTTILGWAQRLRLRRHDQDTVARGLEIIEQQARSQSQLIEDILDVSRIITGKLRLTIGPVDVAAVINAAIDAVQLAADAKTIHLAVVLDPSARRVAGDSGRLQQIFWNLLSNAIKFTSPGGRVEVRVERSGDSVSIGVSDTGEGIEPEFLPFIFERFRQANGSSTRSHGGLGLGLAIVRHLVELHGGRVQVASPGPGRGATFTVTLPLAPVEARARRQPRAVSGKSGRLESMALAQSLPSLEGVNVLLVDDDYHTRQILAMTLADAGATTQMVASVAEARAVLQWYRPDVLVSDLAMPQEDGYALIAHVRAAEADGALPLPAVALTAYVRVEDRVRALSAGFNMFVPKPVEPSELIAVIASLTTSS